MQKKAKPTSLKDVPLSVDSLKFEDLRFFLRIWDEINANPGISFPKAQEYVYGKEYATKYGKNHIDMMASFLNQSFYVGTSRRRFVNKAKTPFILVLKRMLKAVDQYSARSENEVCLRFGVGHSVAMSIVPAIMRELRLSYPSFEVSLFINDSDKLEEQLEAGEIDCLLSVFPASKVPKKAQQVQALIPAVIACHSNPVAAKFRSTGLNEFSPSLLTAKLFQNKFLPVVHIFEGAAIQDPKAIVAADSPNIHIRFSSQPTYLAINELVSNGNDLGVSIPHFLTNEQSLRIQVMPITKNIDRPVLVFMTCNDLSTIYGNMMDELTNKKFGEFLHELSKRASDQIIEAKRYNERLQAPLQPVSQECYLKMPIPNKKGGFDWSWIYGRYSEFARVGANFTGEVALTRILRHEDKEPINKTFAVNGSVQRVEGKAGNWTEFVVIHGRALDQEIFGGSFIRSKQNDLSFGNWQGWEKDQLVPTMGPMVIVEQNAKLSWKTDLDMLVSEKQPHYVIPQKYLGIDQISWQAEVRS